MLFKTPDLIEIENGVLAKIDDLRRTLGYAMSTSRKWTGLLRRNTFAKAIQGSNTIEGYNVTDDDAIAIVEDQVPLDAEAEAWAAVKGYRNALTYILQLADDPHFAYSADLFRALHYMMLHYDPTKNPGRWRPGPIAVRNDQKGEIVYEGPPAEEVPGLIAELVKSLSHVDLGLPSLVRAAMGHLNLVMIHPFKDGNGRMARCLQTLVLAREGILAKDFCSIEEYLGRNTPEYYAVLGSVGGGRWHPERDARPWIRFCLKAHFFQATTLLRRTREMERLWEILEREIQAKGLPERAIVALSDGAMGYRVRNSTYRASAGEVSENLASRDLKLTVEAGFLVPHGERRGRFYVGSPYLRALRERTREPRKIEDPFQPQDPQLPGMSV